MIEELQERLANSYDAAVTDQELNLIQEEIDNCVGQIVDANGFRAAEPIMDRLAQLHGVLAMAWYKHDINILPPQKTLVRKYDRHDVQSLGKDVFEKIRSGQFFT